MALGDLFGGGGGGLSGLLATNPALASIGSTGGAGLVAGGVPTGINWAMPPGAGNAFANIAGEPEVAGTAMQLGTSAQTLGSEAQPMIQSLLTGQLPSGAQAVVDQYLKDASNQARGNFARLGLTGSSAEADTLADIQEKGAAQQFQIAQQIANTGVQISQVAAQEFGAEAQAWSSVMKAELDKDKEKSDAMSGLFGAIGSAFGGLFGKGGALGAGGALSSGGALAGLLG